MCKYSLSKRHTIKINNFSVWDLLLVEGQFCSFSFRYQTQNVLCVYEKSLAVSPNCSILWTVLTGVTCDVGVSMP